MLAGVSLVERHPLRAPLVATRADARAEVRAHLVGHEELRVFRPAVVALGETNLLVAERLAVRGVRVLLVRRAPRDVTVDDDQRGPIRLALEDLEGTRKHVE